MKSWITKKLNNNEISRGGDAGEIFIVTRKVVGDGKIIANGGDGSTGGKGGKVTIISEENQFRGKISAKGGKSFSSRKRWWENSLVQIIALISAILGIIGFLLIFFKL
jgi:hypothetical protein